MSIPVATTTITILREQDVRDPHTPPDVDPWGDGYDEDADTVPDAVATWVPVATGVRATIATPVGRALFGLGNTSTITFALAADPCDLRNGDRVDDQTTGRRFAVNWAEATPGVDGMLVQVVAGITSVEGFGQ
jgi:hypothetical protein